MSAKKCLRKNNNDTCLNVKCLTRKKEKKKPTNTQTHLTHRRKPNRGNNLLVKVKISFSTRFKLYFYTNANETLNKTKNETSERNRVNNGGEKKKKCCIFVDSVLYKKY
uniref:(northern house mosquito) hypothetical protein n=1 Tax=Culex pipiens TaxID=7175 RepID=A0A8D8DRD9_CULPI